MTGSVSVQSDYRLRGVSQSDRQMAVQAGLTIAHDSGAYIGTWASNLAGWGTFGGANMELDLIGGYKTKISPTGTLDVGLTWKQFQHVDTAVRGEEAATGLAVVEEEQG